MMVCFWQGGWVEQLQSESSGEPGLGWRCAHQLLLGDFGFVFDGAASSPQLVLV